MPSPKTKLEQAYRRLTEATDLIAAADVGYHSTRYRIDEERRCAVMLEADDGPEPFDFGDSGELGVEVEDLEAGPVDDAGFQPLPATMQKKGSYSKANTLFKRWIRTERPLELWKSPTFKLWSKPGETERDFRIRLQTVAAEERDRQCAALRKRYGGKLTTLNNRLLRAEQSIEREAEQARRSKVDSAISVGTAILSVFLGRKRLTATSVSRASSASKNVGRVAKEHADVARAEQTAAAVRTDIQELEQTLETEVAGLDSAFDPETEAMETLPLRPKSTDIHVHFVALGWAPYVRQADGTLMPAWT